MAKKAKEVVEMVEVKKSDLISMYNLISSYIETEEEEEEEAPEEEEDDEEEEAPKTKGKGKKQPEPEEDDDDEEEEEEEEEEEASEDEEEVTGEDLLNMDFEELEDFVEDNELGTDPDDFEEDDVDSLRKAIAKEIGVTLPKKEKDKKKKK